MGTYSGTISISNGPGAFSVVAGGQTLATGVRQYTVSGKNDITITATNKISSYTQFAGVSKSGDYTIRINITSSSSTSASLSFRTGYSYALKDGTQTVASGIAASVKLPSRSKTGYDFLGWSSSSSSSSAEYASGATWTLTGDGQTLYAVWKHSEYTVTLDRQGGDSGSTTVTATYDENLPHIQTPQRTGYRFGGYFTSTGGGGTQYYDWFGDGVQTWDKTSGATLYAYWIPISYQVGLDPSSGSGGDTEVLATYGQPMPPLNALPTRTGYTFGGYYTNTGGGGTQYYTASGTSARNWDIAGSPTLHAKWTPNTYYLVENFDAHVVNFFYKINGATSWTQATVVTQSGKRTATISGIQFNTQFSLYWTTDLGYQPAYDNGASIGGSIDNPYVNTWTWANDIPASRNWRLSALPLQYTVTLDRQSGSGGTASVTATYDSAMPTITVPTRTGYTFGGYFTGTGGSGTKYYNADGSSARSWSVPSNTTLYAKWNINQYQVTFSANGGAITANQYNNPQTFNYNDTLDFRKITVSRTGYTFDGWWTAQVGGTRFGDTVPVTSSSTVYAHWTPKKTIVTLEKDGSVVGDSSVEATYEQAMPTITPPARRGYTFDGYFLNRNNSRQYYDSGGQSVRIWDREEESRPLYPHWTAKKCSIAISANGGTYLGKETYFYPSNDPSGRCLETGSASLNILDVAVRNGFVFAGYYTAATGGTMVYDASGKAVQGDYWTDDYAHGGTFKGLENENVLLVYAHWLASVTVEMSAICGDTDAQGRIPDAAGKPTVKIGGVSGEVSVSAVVTQDDALEVYASAEVRGMKISRIVARDASGTLVDKEVAPADAEGGFCKAKLVPRTNDITVSAVYSRNQVSVSVDKGTASKSLSPSPRVDPAQSRYLFGDEVSFVTDASATGDYPFFCWSDSPDAPTAEPDEAVTAATYQVTLTGDTALYAHYAKVVGVTKRAADSVGVVTEDEGGSVRVFALGVERAAPVTGIVVPFGGTLRIVSTADAENGYHFLGIKFRSGSTERDTGYSSDDTFQPEGNGTYEVTFQKNPPDVYLACADVAEDGAAGTVGQTVATYNGTEEGAFEPVDAADVPAFENAPQGARWYKVRAGTVVTLTASRASAANALSWKGVDYVDLVEASEPGEEFVIPESLDPSARGDSSPSSEVWRNRSYAVGGNKAVVTTWGNYPAPKVTLSARTGGSAVFKGEDPGLREKVYEAELDPETGIYTYQTATVVAEAYDGYVFVGWYSSSLAQVVSDAAEYSFEVRQNESLEAVFRKDDNAVFEWEGGTSKKMVEWRSGVITVPRPSDPVAARVDATGYPVEFDVGTYSSPDAEPTQQHAVKIISQDGRRLPRLRPERFWRMSVRARAEIDAIAVATNIVEVN